jgi:hypothetical protein
MGKKNENRIPAAYWENGTGANLYDRMHHDGQRSAGHAPQRRGWPDHGGRERNRRSGQAGLEKARKQIRTSLRAFPRGFYGLSSEGF